MTLQARLSAAQDAMSAALDDGDVEAFARIVRDRAADVRTLAGRARELDAFVRSFLIRDRALEARAEAVRDATKGELALVQRRKAAGRAYLSDGART